MLQWSATRLFSFLNGLRDTFVAVYIAGAIASHSFRISAATVDAHAGTPDHLVQAMRREMDKQCLPTLSPDPRRSFGTINFPYFTLTSTY